MKKSIISLIILFTFLTIVSPLSAETNLGREIKETIKETVEEGKEASLSPKEIRRDVRKTVKEEVQDRKQNLLNKVKDFMKKNLRFEARVKGKITVIGSNNFSLSGDDGTFQINITDKTKILRKFGGKSSFSELSVGNELMVFGKFTDDTKSVIDAKTIKNNSIQKRFGAFFGKVTVKNSDNFVMETAERGTQTVYFGDAKFVQRNEINMTYSDLKIGNRVRVKGIWDKALSKINEVIQIKDFSIPVVAPTETAED